MKINRQFLESLDPCQDRLDNYLEHYCDFSGSFLEFLELTEITTEDKLWVVTRKIEGLEEIQREFALICAARAVDDCNVVEVHDYFNLILLAHNDNVLQEIKQDKAYRAAYRAADWATYYAADYAAYYAAYRAADCAADYAADYAAYYAADYTADRLAEKETQLKILKSLAEEYGL